VWPQHHSRRDILSQPGVRHGKSHGSRHRRVVHQGLVHFLGGDLLSAAVDDLLAATGEEQVSLVVEKALVPGPEPTVPERVRRRRGATIIAVHDARAPHDDLARPTAGQERSAFVHDGHVQSHRYTRGAGLALTRRQGIAGDRGGRDLGHTVELNDGNRESPFQILEDAVGQRR
jgi:hypothetical protein